MLSDEGMHFVNKMIDELTTEFHIHHRKKTPYHPQENGTIEAFNKILENALTKVCTVHRNERDHKVSVLLWEYQTT